MNSSKLRYRILSISPHLEVLIRRLYWSNAGVIETLFFNKHKNKKRARRKSTRAKPQSNLGVDGKSILGNAITGFGLNSGDTLLVHSAYANLKPLNMTPVEIVEELERLIGPSGTLAMPAMPKFRNDPEKHQFLAEDITNSVFKYDADKTPIKTGLLPTTLHRMDKSVRSRHPINSMVAKGRLAYELLDGNLKDESSLPCGIDSSWYRCSQENALIIGLGLDLTHSLTSIHVNEDLDPEKWPISNWYRTKKYIIENNGKSTHIDLKERHPKWGTMHFAERTLAKDLHKNGILHSRTIAGIAFEAIRAKELFEFLNDKKGNGYPYYDWN